MRQVSRTGAKESQWSTELRIVVYRRAATIISVSRCAHKVFSSGMKVSGGGSFADADDADHLGSRRLRPVRIWILNSQHRICSPTLSPLACMPTPSFTMAQGNRPSADLAEFDDDSSSGPRESEDVEKALLHDTNDERQEKKKRHSGSKLQTSWNGLLPLTMFNVCLFVASCTMWLRTSSKHDFSVQEHWKATSFYCELLDVNIPGRSLSNTDPSPHP